LVYDNYTRGFVVTFCGSFICSFVGKSAL
jgi:hypothetical protein